LRPSQIKLLGGWLGHYQIVTTLEEILFAIGAVKETAKENVDTGG
jgi:hypothetical protein